MVIVNLQRTPFDHVAFHVFSKTDIFMELLMQELGCSDFSTDQVENWDILASGLTNEQNDRISSAAKHNTLAKCVWGVVSLSFVAGMLLL